MARRTLPHGEKTLWFPKKEKFKDFKVLLWPPNSPHFNLNGHLQGFSCLKMGLCILTVHVTTTRSHMIKTRDTLFKCKSLHLPVFYNHMIHSFHAFIWWLSKRNPFLDYYYWWSYTWGSLKPVGTISFVCRNRHLWEELEKPVWVTEAPPSTLRTTNRDHHHRCALNNGIFMNDSSSWNAFLHPTYLQLLFLQFIEKEFACGVKTICRGEKHQKNKTTDSNMKLLYLM